MAGAASRGRHRHGYDDVLADGLVRACLLLAVVFAGFAAWHPFALSGAAAPSMTAVAGGTSAVLAGTAVALRNRTPPAGRAHAVGAALALAVFVNSAVHYAFTEQAYLSVNVTLTLVGVGVCLVDPRWIAATVAGMGAAWLALVSLVTGAAAALASAPNLMLGAAVAALANGLRLGTLNRLLDTQAELRALSQRDELTGLLNRRGFLESAQRRLGMGRSIRVWFVDVDGLKHVNDTRGHDEGDVLLACVATALAEVFAGAVVARLSGDEFAVVDEHGSADGAEQARAALQQRLELAARATGLPVSVSTGVATSRPGQSLTEVLAAADAAMYAQKAAGRPVPLPAEPAAVD